MHTRMSLAVIASLMLMPIGGCCFSHNSESKVSLENDSAISCSGGPVTIDVLANDDIGSKVTITSVTIPTAPGAALGTALVNSDNTITFTPAAGASGEATFEYQVDYDKPASSKKKKGSSSSSTTGSKTAQVSVFLRTSDSAPTAVDDTATTQASVSVLVDVLGNDTDPDSDSPGGAGLKITDVATPNLGTAVTEGKQVRYTPPDDTTTGDATFQYTITDSCGNAATATVTVTIEAAASAARLAATSSSSTCQHPAKVLLVNNSNFEITVSVGDKEVDVVQPLGSTVVPAKVASGDQTIKVVALLPDPDPARETTTNFTFASKGRYTITYSDDNVNPATIDVAETP